jgi:hypothetical protein
MTIQNAASLPTASGRSASSAAASRAASSSRPAIVSSRSAPAKSLGAQALGHEVRERGARRRSVTSACQAPARGRLGEEGHQRVAQHVELPGGAAVEAHPEPNGQAREQAARDLGRRDERVEVRLVDGPVEQVGPVLEPAPRDGPGRRGHAARPRVDDVHRDGPVEQRDVARVGGAVAEMELGDHALGVDQDEVGVEPPRDDAAPVADAVLGQCRGSRTSNSPCSRGARRWSRRRGPRGRRARTRRRARQSSAGRNSPHMAR